jgi:hypothetical protein
MITIEQAKKLNTKRLLAYYKSIIRDVSCDLRFAYEVRCTCKYCRQLIKKHKEREAHREEIKELLNKRENIDRQREEK